MKMLLAVMLILAPGLAFADSIVEDTPDRLVSASGPVVERMTLVDGIAAPRSLAGEAAETTTSFGGSSVPESYQGAE